MKNIHSIRCLALLVVTLTLFQTCREKENNSSDNSQPQALDVEAFEEKINNTSDKIVLDVRTPEEYGEGHLEGATLIDFRSGNFSEQINTLDKSKPVFVYCAGGGRSEKAANMLREKGFTEVYNLSGGLNDWVSANKPVVKK